MTAKEKIDKILKATGLEITELAVESKIIPNSLKVAIKRDTLSSDIVTKISERFGVRKEFFKDGREPILIEKPTRAENVAAVKENAEHRAEVYRKVIEGETEYLMVPRAAFDGNYRFIPIEEIELHAKELERWEAELIRKDNQIQGMYELFRMIASGLTVDPSKIDLSKIKEAEKNAGV